MKKIIAIVLVCVFLLSLCGCKSGDTNSDITSEKPQYISLPKVEAIEVSTNATKKGTIITDKKDFEFLTKYYCEREIRMDEFATMVDMTKAVLIKITEDTVLYLLEDGKLVEPVMDGNSDLTKRTFLVYTANENVILNKARLEALLGKYKKSNDTDKTESEDTSTTSSKTDTDNTSSDGPTTTICPQPPKNEEQIKPTTKNVLPTVKYNAKDITGWYGSLTPLKNGGFLTTGEILDDENAFSIIRVFDKNGSLRNEYKCSPNDAFNLLTPTSDGGFIAGVNYNPYIKKLNKNFEVEWTGKYEDVALTSFIKDVEEISPDCYAVLFLSRDDPNENHLNLSYIDKNGNFIEKVQSMKSVDPLDPDIIPDGNGGFYLTTACDESLAKNFPLVEKNYKSSNDIDAAILHFSAERELDWIKTFGGGGKDWIEEATIDEKGNFYVAVATNWDGSDNFWPKPYADWCYSRRMLVKLDKNGEIKYKIAFSNSGRGEDTVYGIHLKGDKVYVVGYSNYFDGLQSKYPCQQITEGNDGDTVYSVNTLIVDDKKGKEIHRNIYRLEFDNRPSDSIMLPNGNIIISGSVCEGENIWDLRFPENVSRMPALFIYEN